MPANRLFAVRERRVSPPYGLTRKYYTCKQVVKPNLLVGIAS